MGTRRAAVRLSLVFALCAAATSVRAETINCIPINTLPAVITLPGIYCFTHALTTNIAAGNAIDVQANNVVIDMNGFRLGGLGAGLGTSAQGIKAVDRQNITIRNGTVRGFFIAVDFESLGNSQGHLVEDVRADQNTAYGIVAECNGCIIRNNQIVATGGTTGVMEDPVTAGIVVGGNGNRVQDNDVTTVTDPSGGGLSVGIGAGEGADNMVVGNRITNADDGILFFSGTGKYRNNLTSGVTTPYTGGTDAGGNN